MGLCARPCNSVGVEASESDTKASRIRCNEQGSSHKPPLALCKRRGSARCRRSQVLHLDLGHRRPVNASPASASTARQAPGWARARVPRAVCPARAVPIRNQRRVALRLRAHAPFAPSCLLAYHSWLDTFCSSSAPFMAAVRNPAPSLSGLHDLAHRFPSSALMPCEPSLTGEEAKMGAATAAAEGGPQAAAPRRCGAGHEDADHHAQRQVQAQAAQARASEGAPSTRHSCRLRALDAFAPACVDHPRSPVHPWREPHSPAQAHLTCCLLEYCSSWRA